MKKMMFLAVMMVMTISATANTSWPSTSEAGKFPSWPVESTMDVLASEPKFPKFPSWPSLVSSWPAI